MTPLETTIIDGLEEFTEVLEQGASQDRDGLPRPLPRCPACDSCNLETCYDTKPIRKRCQTCGNLWEVLESPCPPPRNKPEQ